MKKEVYTPPTDDGSKHYEKYINDPRWAKATELTKKRRPDFAGANKIVMQIMRDHSI